MEIAIKILAVIVLLGVLAAIWIASIINNNE